MTKGIPLEVHNPPQMSPTKFSLQFFTEQMAHDLTMDAECDPRITTAHSPVPFLKMGTTIPVCQARGTTPEPQRDVAARQTYNT